MSTKNNLKISQAFLSLSKTCLAHKSLITEAKLKKNRHDNLSLISLNYPEHNSIVPQDKRYSVLTRPLSTLLVEQIKEQ